MAALFVFTRHAEEFFGRVQFPHSYLAVDLFFVMSGFVIAAAYEHGLAIGKITFSDFVKIRLIRLYPLYLLALFWAATLAIHHQGKTDASHLTLILVEIVFGVLIIPSPVPGGGSTSLFPLNGPSWSIFFELVANVLYAKLRVFLTNQILQMVLAISAMALTVCVLIKGNLDFGFNWKGGIGGFPRVLYSFSAGLLVYRMRGEGQRISNKWAILVLITTALVLAVPISDKFYIYDLIIVFIGFPVLVLMASYVEPDKKLGGLFAILGVTSYAIYILQSPYVWTYSALVLKKSTQPLLIMGGMGLLVYFLICLAVDRFYDMPVRYWLRQRFLKKIPMLPK